MSTSAVPFEVAAVHATAHVPVTRPEASAREVKRSLEGRRFESASQVVVCQRDRFAGMLRIEDLLAAPDDARVAELMDATAPTIRPGVDQEKAAWLATAHGESALAVVDDEGRFVGLIPPSRLLAVLLQEHEEDLARLGGFLERSSAARRASEESVPRRFWHRLPWLLLGLAGALVAADIVGWFESQLERKVLLAFFLPGIVYLADAVGTQTETVMVRGLSVGVRMRRVVGLELLTGVGVGLALAAAAGPLVYWRWGDAGVATSVAVAIFATCSTATLIAMCLPWALDRVGVDPAFGSGPLATVLQDLLSIVMYFSIASAAIG
ncbi:MAG: magnesium transporter [Polyangiaceae bacterium]|nr:magnesium transporter [Polyangiaceae bacterium]